MNQENALIILPSWLITSPLQPPKFKYGIRIQGSDITHVAPCQELEDTYPFDQKIDAQGKLLAPGFVNTHTHMYGVLAHGIPANKAPTGFWSFLTDFWWTLIEDRLDQEMICAATNLRCANLLQSGVTSFYDCTEAPNALPGCLPAQAEVVEKWGLRAILSFEATERISRDNGQAGLNENTRFIQQCHHKQAVYKDYLISGLMCHHTLFTCSPKFIIQSYELAQENQTLFHAHVSEGTYEPEYTLKEFGKRPFRVYQDMGMANDRFLASQCVQIDTDEINLISKNGVRVSHMPLSNCEVGGGIAPIPQMAEQNTSIGLGSDGYIDDFYEIMRGAFLIHKANHLDPRAMPANLVWYMGTEGGARTLGLEKVGRIAVGWKADVQLIDTTLPTPVEEHNLYEQMLLYRTAANVDMVMVNGKIKKSSGKLLDTDMDELSAKTREQAKRLWEAAR